MSRPHALVALGFVLAAIAWAGLSPFDFARRNRVTWLDPGLRFEGGGVACSDDVLRWDTRGATAEFGLEIWLRAGETPAEAEQRCILVLVDGSPTSVLGIRQEGTDLVVWDRVINPDGERWYNDFRLPDVLRPGEIRHVALSSSGLLPSFYVDGQGVEPSEGFGIPIARQDRPFEGRLAIGAGPPWIVPWSGEMLGLVLHWRALGADDVQRHARLAPGAGVVSIGRESGVLALYAFDEGGGRRVRDHVGGGSGLDVPDYFRPPGQRLLALPNPRDWTEGWNAIDAIVNLVGFVPLGFLLAVVLGGRRWRRSRTLVLAVAAIGAVISLGIELSQVLLVTRNSSLQDLVLNTLGSVGGAWLAIRSGAAPPGRSRIRDEPLRMRPRRGRCDDRALVRDPRENP